MVKVYFTDKYHEHPDHDVGTENYDYCYNADGNTDLGLVTIKDICASDLDKVYCIILHLRNDYENRSVGISPMHYCYQVLASATADEQLKDLVRALYVYNQKANAYFG